VEIAKEQLNLGYGQVVEFGSWEGFKLAAASQDDAFLMVGVYDGVPEALSKPEIGYVAGSRQQVMGLWEEGSCFRFDCYRPLVGIEQLVQQRDQLVATVGIRLAFIQLQ